MLHIHFKNVLSFSIDSKRKLLVSDSFVFIDLFTCNWLGFVSWGTGFEVFNVLLVVALTEVTHKGHCSHIGRNEQSGAISLCARSPFQLITSQWQSNFLRPFCLVEIVVLRSSSLIPFLSIEFQSNWTAEL